MKINDPSKMFESPSEHSNYSYWKSKASNTLSDVGRRRFLKASGGAGLAALSGFSALITQRALAASVIVPVWNGSYYAYQYVVDPYGPPSTSPSVEPSTTGIGMLTYEDAELDIDTFQFDSDVLPFDLQATETSPDNWVVNCSSYKVRCSINAATANAVYTYPGVMSASISCGIELFAYNLLAGSADGIVDLTAPLTLDIPGFDTDWIECSGPMDLEFSLLGKNFDGTFSRLANRVVHITVSE